MDTKKISASMENGRIICVDRYERAEQIEWNEHPKFKGVFLKHLVNGRDTAGCLSCHLVQIDPNAVLEEHIHDNQWELHEIIEGEGNFILDDKETSYYPGCMAIIPKGTKHKVIAGINGIILLAEFFPALS